MPIWRQIYNTISRISPPDLMTVMNYGYAVLSDSGVYLDKYKHDPLVLQLQMYDYLVTMVGGIKDMKGKTLVEVGSGRGGAFKYMVEEFKP